MFLIPGPRPHQKGQQCQIAVFCPICPKRWQLRIGDRDSRVNIRPSSVVAVSLSQILVFSRRGLCCVLGFGVANHKTRVHRNYFQTSRKRGGMEVLSGLGQLTGEKGQLGPELGFL